jgi:hypothetical protein
MATSQSNIPSSHPQAPSTQRPAVSRRDWNKQKRWPRTPRAEWSIVQSYLLPICADAREDSTRQSAAVSEVVQ